MRAIEQRITGFLHSTAGAAVLAVAALAASYFSFNLGDIPALGYDKGMGFPSPGLWVNSPATSAALGAGCTLACAALMIYINARFNLLRDITRLFAGLFITMQAACPAVIDNFYGGSLLPVAVLLALTLLYSCYNRPVAASRHVFLAFALLSAGAMTQYGFIGYLPLFLMGCGQMRVFTWRSLIAALMGIVTPVWICLAFGWVTTENLLHVTFDSVNDALPPSQALQFASVAGFTSVLGVTLCIINLVKVFSYNSRSRSYNGFVSLLLFFTCLLGAVDFTNALFYLPMLNCCVAYQAAQFFVINRQRRSYAVVLGIIAVYAAFYIWWMFVSIK